MQKLKDRIKYPYYESIIDGCHDNDLPIPIFEFKFDPTRKYKADMAYPARDLLIEIEGGAFVQGRHNRGTGFIADMAKYNLMVQKGYYLLRFTPQQIRNGEAFIEIKKFFERGKQGKHE